MLVPHLSLYAIVMSCSVKHAFAKTGKHYQLHNEATSETHREPEPCLPCASPPSDSSQVAPQAQLLVLSWDHSKTADPYKQAEPFLC